MERGVSLKFRGRVSGRKNYCTLGKHCIPRTDVTLPDSTVSTHTNLHTSQHYFLLREREGEGEA